MPEQITATITQVRTVDAVIETPVDAVAATVVQVLTIDAVLLATTEETVAIQINMVRGDTRPTLELTVKDQNGTVINLTGATGIFRIRRKGFSTVLVSRAVTITDAVNGKCQFVWVAADWNAGALDAPGDYEGELEITFSAGVIGTTFDPYQIYVREQLG